MVMMFSVLAIEISFIVVIILRIRRDLFIAKSSVVSSVASTARVTVLKLGIALIMLLFDKRSMFYFHVVFNLCCNFFAL